MANTELHTIASDSLTVSISAAGAELQSVVCDGVERMWCADPAVWPRHAPLLFPLIGRMRDGKCGISGQLVSVPRHGFCRDRVFEAEQLSPTCVRFSTQSDTETRAAYPFDFALEVEFSVEGSTLAKTHRVVNTGSTPIPFELGGHEAYAICFHPGERASDYYVRFDAAQDDVNKDGIATMCAAEQSPSTAQISQVEAFQMDEEGILQLPKVAIALQDNCLRQTPEQLGLDTIVLEGLPERSVTLACDKNNHAVTVEFSDFPYLGIWTKPVGEGHDARYLCIEPWSALPDGHFMPRELSEKPGVRTLNPGEEAVLTYRMHFQ